MTKDLAQKLIDHYEMVIDLIKKTDDVSVAKNIAEDHYAHRGICHCAAKVFGVYELYSSAIRRNWVKSFPNSYMGDYWFDIPCNAMWVSDVIRLLQLRVNRLKTFKDDN